MAKKTKPDFEDMGYETAEPEERYPVHDWSKGDVLWGLLIDKRQVETQMGVNHIYSIEIKEDCKEYNGIEADRVSFWGSEILNSRLKNCEPGTHEIVVEYLGKKKGEKFTYYDFRVMHKEVGDFDKDAEEVLDE